MSAADCMNNNLESYIHNPVQLGSCPSAPAAPAPADATYLCLCAQSSFTSWYLSTLCINCDGSPNPVSNLTAICPSFAESITTTYPNSCSPYGVKEAGDPASSTGINSSSLTIATLSSSSSTPSPGPSRAEVLTSSSTSTMSTLTTTGPTTIIVSMTTPSRESSTSSKLLTLTAVAASPFTRPSSIIPASNKTTSSVLPSPTFASTNETFTGTSAPTTIPLLGASSSNSGMSTGAKAGIGVGAAAAAVGICFVFMALLTILRRRNSRVRPGYDAGYAGRSIGDNGAGDTSTTLADMYHDDDPRFYRGFGGSDGYSGNESRSGLGIGGIGTGPREKMGFVPSGRIQEVTVGVGNDLRSAAPFHAEGVREIHHVDEQLSEYSNDDDFVAPQESDNVWPASPAHVAFEHEEDATQRYSTHLQDAGVRYSTAQESPYSTAQDRYSAAQESNYEAAMRPKSRIYSVVESPVLDLGQEGLSDEELARLEDEERRIDEAIRESESRAKPRTERGDIGTVL